MNKSKTNVLPFFIICLFIGANFTSSGVTENIKNTNIPIVINELHERNKSSFISSIPPEESWNETFGGSSYDEGYAIQQTSDNGFIITGGTLSFGAGNWDVWLIKTDAHGNEELNTTFGGSGYDKGESLQETNDGGYIIGGCTTSYGNGSFDLWLIKTDANGNEEWNTTFGGINEDKAYAVGQTIDGGYFISGSTASFGAGYADFYLVKTDANGNKIWQTTFGGSLPDQCFSTQITTDGGYILTGYTGSFDDDYTGCDVWLVKVDANGNEEWNTTFGGTGVENKFDIAYAVQQTDDNGYVLAGETKIEYVTQMDVLLIKTNINGEEEWMRTFGEEFFESSRSVQQTTDGGYIITGNKEVLIGTELNPEIWMIKTDSEGYEEWNQIYGFETGSGDWGYAVQQTDDEGFIVAGCTMPDPFPKKRKNSFFSDKYEGTDLWLIKIAENEDNSVHISDLIKHWNFISVPLNQTIHKLDLIIKYETDFFSWSDAVANDYINDFLFGWNRSIQSYRFADSLAPGEGYWLYANVDCELWVENITVTIDDFTTDIKKQWNIISMPYNETIDKEDIIIDINNTMYSWNDAVDHGIISNVVFTWIRTTQQYSFSENFSSGNAYWMYAYNNCIIFRSLDDFIIQAKYY